MLQLLKTISYVTFFSMFTMTSSLQAALDFTKHAYPEYIEGSDRNVTTTIVLHNDTSKDYIDINITDIIPPELGTISYIEASTILTCTGEGTTTLNCSSGENNLTADDIASIVFQVTAQNIDATVTNTASLYTVNAANSGDTIDTTASATTILVKDYNASQTYDLCYADVTDYNNSDCLQAGHFYYGSECTTSFTIINSSGTSATIYKGYTEAIKNKNNDKPSCNGSNCTFSTPTNGYGITDALAFTVGDRNTTITDYNVHPADGATFDYILLLDANGDAVYPCAGAYGSLPNITPVTDVGLVEPTDPNNNYALGDTFDFDTHKLYTKVVNKPFSWKAYYLDHDVVTDFQTNWGTGGNNVDGFLALFHADSCPSDSAEELVDYYFSNGEHVVALDNLSIDKAYKEHRIIIKFIDYAGFFRQLESFKCSQSSLESSLCGLPACMNSYEQILRVFPIGLYPHVQTCLYGDGSGKKAPCDSSAYKASPSCGGKKEEIGPEKYNNDIGCASCLADAIREPTCSDPFAIRPDQFDTAIEYYEALVAGYPYTKAFYAYEYNSTTPAQNYNETEGVSFDVNITIADINKTCAVTNLNFPNFTFVDGLKDVNFSLGDIGDFNLSIAEINGSEFALIDQDDTPDEDRLITPFTVPIHVIPDHFTIDANLTDHNSDNNFTYLHDINTYGNEDNHSMGALLNVNISARGADENITTNYINTCYAKETNLTLLLSDVNITYPGSTPALTQFLYYNPNEDNGTAHSGESSYALPSLTNITQLPLANNAATFSSNAPDGNGTAHIEYKLNFDRKQNLPVNPFKLTLLDANITDEDNVTGSDEVNQSATFYYARTRASKFFYDDVTDTNISTPILIDVYCGLGFTACDSLVVNTVNGQINEINWWLSLEHNATHGDGTITLTKGSITEGSSSDWYVSPTANITTNAIDPTVSVGRGSDPTLPLTVEIELDAGTNHWLIYNPNDPILPPSPFYKVRFIGTSGWAGYGDTGHVVETNASVKKHNRLEW